MCDFEKKCVICEGTKYGRKPLGELKCEGTEYTLDEVKKMKDDHKVDYVVQGWKCWGCDDGLFRVVILK